jgi:hypothetical protein
MRSGRVAGVLCLMLLAPPALALTVHSLQSTYTVPTYHVSLIALIDAPPQDVEAVLVDYPNYRTLDPRIRSSDVLSATSPDAAIVRTRVRFCAAFFCRTIDRVENVVHRPGELVATVIPERSQLKRGVTRTTWRAEGSGTLVTYDAEFVPAFRVPDIIARRYATRALRDSTANLFANVEREAHAR